jgi:hypothetical protein
MKFLTFAFLLLSSTQLLASERAQDLFNEAMTLIKEDHRGNSKRSLKLLKKAQRELINEGELDESQEALLVKINTNIYWQAKLGSVNDSAPVSAKRERPTEGPGETEKVDPLGTITLNEELLEKQKGEWEEKKKEQAGEFELELQSAEAYEKNHGGDPMSNMLNYLDLQTKVVDLEKAQELMKKAEKFNKAISSKRQSVIDRGMASLKNYEEHLKNKDYIRIFEHIKTQFRLKKVSPKDFETFRLYGMEMKAMAKLKNILLNLDRTKAIPLPRIPHQVPANVLRISESGLQLKYEDGEQGFMSWPTVSEKILLGMATSLIDATNDSNIFTLALSHLRLENYDEAYRLFHQLVDNSGENFIKYKDFLAMCEMGYRLKNGPRFEEIFLEADSFANEGNRRKALTTLKDFKKDYLSSLLGRSYLDRFKVLYYDILRS